MSRNVLVVGALLLVAALLWTIAAWPTQVVVSEPSEAASEPPPLAAASTPTPPLAAPAAPPPPAPAPPAAPAQPAAAPQPAQELPPPSGPIAELEQRFETEPRDSAASGVESYLRDLFVGEDMAPTMFKSVMCRQSVCKLALRLGPDRMGSYMGKIPALLARFTSDIGVRPTAEVEGDNRLTEIYLQRLAQPTPAQEP